MKENQRNTSTTDVSLKRTSTSSSTSTASSENPPSNSKSRSGRMIRPPPQFAKSSTSSEGSSSDDDDEEEENVYEGSSSSDFDDSEDEYQPEARRKSLSSKTKEKRSKSPESDRREPKKLNTLDKYMCKGGSKENEPGNQRKFTLFENEAHPLESLAKIKSRPEKQREVVKFSEEEQIRMWRFVLRELKDPAENPTIRRFWERYKVETNSPRWVGSIEQHYRHFMAKKLCHMQLERDEILELYRLVPIKITDAIADHLSKKFNVETRLEESGNRQYLVAWRPRDGDDQAWRDKIPEKILRKRERNKKPGTKRHRVKKDSNVGEKKKHKRKSKIERQPYTVEDHTVIWCYVYRALKRDPNVDLAAFRFWKKFVKEVNYDRIGPNVGAHFSRQMLQKLFSAEIPGRMKMELYKRLQIPIDEQEEIFLNSLYEGLSMQLSSKRTLVEYRIGPVDERFGNIEVYADHIVRSAFAERIKRQKREMLANENQSAASEESSSESEPENVDNRTRSFGNRTSAVGTTTKSNKDTAEAEGQSDENDIIIDCVVVRSISDVKKEVKAEVKEEPGSGKSDDEIQFVREIITQKKKKRRAEDNSEVKREPSSPGFEPAPVVRIAPVEVPPVRPERERSASVQNRVPEIEFSAEDEIRLMKFLHSELNKTFGSVADPFAPRIWAKFSAISGCQFEPVDIAKYVKNELCSQLHKLDLPFDMIINLYKKLNWELSVLDVQKIERKFSLELLMQDRRIVDYTPTVGRTKVSTWISRTAPEFQPQVQVKEERPDTQVQDANVAEEPQVKTEDDSFFDDNIVFEFANEDSPAPPQVADEQLANVGEDPVADRRARKRASPVELSEAAPPAKRTKPDFSTNDLWEKAMWMMIDGENLGSEISCELFRRVSDVRATASAEWQLMSPTRKLLNGLRRGAKLDDLEFDELRRYASGGSNVSSDCVGRKQSVAVRSTDDDSSSKASTASSASVRKPCVGSIVLKEPKIEVEDVAPDDAVLLPRPSKIPKIQAKTTEKWAPDASCRDGNTSVQQESKGFTNKRLSEAVGDTLKKMLKGDVDEIPKAPSQQHLDVPFAELTDVENVFDVEVKSSLRMAWAQNLMSVLKKASSVVQQRRVANACKLVEAACAALVTSEEEYKLRMMESKYRLQSAVDELKYVL